jgi:N6-L-threonylcarbamoyladenine synthase
VRINRDGRIIVTRVLGIETSCDETAAAIVSSVADGDRAGSARIESSIVLSQTDAHRAFGGVVPEIAARAHVEALDAVIAAALDEAGIALADVDAIAATAGPGLMGGLIVGLTTGKALALATDKPFLAINHLEGHALTARLTNSLEFPYLLLLVSGGHSQIVLVEGVGRYRLLGTTIDDAAGEAFDKTAKLLGLGYPGGPAVEQAARSGNPERFALPRPLLGRAEPDFSFAGLKTALRQLAEAASPLSEQDVSDICASFQAAVTDCITDRIARAFAILSDLPIMPTALVAAGGVAANDGIRVALSHTAAEKKLPLILPPLALCGDNAAMIAWAGVERFALGLTDDLDTAPRARWPLAELSEGGEAQSGPRPPGAGT